MMSRNDALRSADEPLLGEKSVRQARWLLIPVFSLYGSMMLVGLLLS